MDQVDRVTAAILVPSGACEHNTALHGTTYHKADGSQAHFRTLKAGDVIRCIVCGSTFACDKSRWGHKNFDWRKL